VIFQTANAALSELRITQAPAFLGAEVMRKLRSSALFGAAQLPLFLSSHRFGAGHGTMGVKHSAALSGNSFSAGGSGPD
jgi:hypothetical protein